MPGAPRMLAANRGRRALSESSSAPAAGPRTIRSLGSSGSTDDNTLAESGAPSLAENEILVYYDAFYPTSGSRPRPMRLRMDAEGVAMVQEEGIGPLDVQKKQKRAHTTGTTPTVFHDVGAPRIARPLVKAVGKATDKIVRLVYNKPKDKVYGKLAEGDNAAASPPVPGEWNDARSGITVVVESECDAGGTTPKAGFSARHNQSQISIETTPDMCLYISPPEPHNSVSTESDEDEPPYLDEQTAMQLINCLYYGDEKGEQNGGVAAAAAVAALRTSSEIHHQPLGARIQQRPQPKQQRQPTPEPQEQEQEPQYAKRQEHVPHPHIRPTSVPPLIKPASPTPARTNVLQLVVLPPWFILVGGLILFWPSALDRAVFQSGILDNPSPTSSPTPEGDSFFYFSSSAPRPRPRALRRFAYWAEYALAHVLAFVLVCSVLGYYLCAVRAGPVPAAAWAVGCALATRFAWVWGSYSPRDGLWQRIGESDRESLWLVCKGQAVVDAAFANQ